MGTFCVNFHLRTTNDKAVADTLNQRGVTRYRLLPTKAQWTSLCEERASAQDDQWIRELGGQLSGDLHLPAIAFLVHDSDIACYWLFDDGRLIDEYNSCPDYFDDSPAQAPMPSGGRPDVLIRYCRSGVNEEDLKAILREHTLFAEDVIHKLADALSIDPEYALADYRRPGAGGEGGDEGGDDDDDGRPPSVERTGLTTRLAQMLGIGAKSPAADPKVLALVRAAAADNADEIDRLLDEGAAIDGEADAPLPNAPQARGLSKFLPGSGGQMALPMTPLLAAIGHKKRRAALRLLERGADPNKINAIFGTPMHAATHAGEVEMLQLLIDHGGNISARDARGQTPLQALMTARATVERLAQAQEMMKSMGGPLGGLMNQLSQVALPKAGWDACEKLLKAHGA